MTWGAEKPTDRTAGVRILFDPPMPPKLFLMLVVVVLLAVLVGGNPFLSKNAAGRVPAVPLSTSAPAAGATLVGMEAAEPLGRVSAEGNEAQPGHAADFADVHRMELPGQTVGAAHRGQRQGSAVLLECPDPLLRHLVVEVETDASGAPIWVLRDGRRLRRNPIVGGKPLLVPVPPTTGKSTTGKPTTGKLNHQ